jgi:hypothetical protein
MSALLGVLITAHVQLRTQKSNQNFQLLSERQLRVNDRLVNERATEHELFGTAHEILSSIQREFSVTSLDIYWRAKMRETEYDQRYLEVCKQLDKLRRIIDFHAPSLSDDANLLYGQMNVFWGFLNNILYRTERGEIVTHCSNSLTKAHAAANKIGEMAILKMSFGRSREKAGKYRIIM